MPADVRLGLGVGIGVVRLLPRGISSGRAVGGEPEPGEVVEQRVDVGLARPCLVVILDAQHHLAAYRPCNAPDVNGVDHMAEMEKPGWGWRETCARPRRQPCGERRHVNMRRSREGLAVGRSMRRHGVGPRRDYAPSARATRCRRGSVDSPCALPPSPDARCGRARVKRLRCAEGLHAPHLQLVRRRVCIPIHQPVPAVPSNLHAVGENWGLTHRGLP